MQDPKFLRPGGRSLRVQKAVHHAVTELITEVDRGSLTVSQVALRAGVTPSTIYRRWGDIETLLGDVAERKLRTECPLKPRGNLADDLLTWAQMYQEEMDSIPGRSLIRDVLCGRKAAVKAHSLFDAARQAIEVICDASKTDIQFDVDAVIDAIVAPLLMRIIFTSAPLPEAFAQKAATAFLAQHVTKK